jgi:sialate O-acetylesterase
MRVWFDHAEGLSLAGKPINGFELAGADHRFIAAEATIEGDTVKVTSAEVPHPKYVRYGWMNVVTNTLYNASG